MPAFRKDAFEIIPAVGNAEQIRTELLVIGVFSDRSLTGAPRRIDELTGGKLSSALAQRGPGAGVGATTLIEDLPGAAASRLLVVSLGPANGFSDAAYLQSLSIVGRLLAQSDVTEVVVAMAEAMVAGKSLHWHVRRAGQSLAMTLAASDAARPQRIMLLVPQTLTSEIVAALRQGIAIAGAIDIARRLADLPRESCTAAHIAGTAMTIGQGLGLEVELLHHDGIAPQERGDGSPIPATEAPVLIVLSSRRGRKARPIILLGEAQTHLPEQDDTQAGAGIGSASAILGAMWMAGRLGLALNLVALIPASEQARSATRTAGTADGQATPALRRILAYAEQLMPDCLIDIAGLDTDDDATAALARDCLYTNDSALAAELVGCGARAGEPVRHLAFDAAMPGRETSAEGTRLHCLSSYEGPCRWAHLDVPDLARDPQRPRPAQGHPVPLLAEFLIGRARPTA